MRLPFNYKKHTIYSGCKSQPHTTYGIQIKVTFYSTTERQNMITEDFVSSILEQTSKKMIGIDQSALKSILEESLSLYDVHVKEGVGATSDLPEKIQIYLSNRKLDGMSNLTLRNYKYSLDRFANFVNKRVTTITVQDIRNYLSYVVETKNIKNSTLETQKTIIKSFFAWLEIEEYITKNPAKKVRPTKVSKKVVDSLTVEELEMMRNACVTARQRCVLELFFSTGMRLAELCQVDITDLDWQNNSIKIIGKGSKERIVYFSDKARLYIKNYLAVRGSFESSALFITSKIPHQRMGHRSIYNEVKKIAENAKVETNVFCHKLRHSFATLGVRSGMSLTTLQDLMGHSEISTTRAYVDSDQETAKYEHRKYIIQ